MSGNTEKEESMGVLTDEEKKRIIEEEELRCKIRMKYEQKSSGIAGVLSGIVPGLGQLYNGQIGKAAFFGFIVLLSLILLSTGITFWIKGVPSKQKETSSIVSEEEPVQINEEGVVIEEESESEETEKEEKKEVPKLPAVLTIVGLAGIGFGWSYSVKDAIKTAKRLNTLE